MTTPQWILFRLVLIVFGRFAWGATLIRKVLVTVLVKNAAGRRYTASSRFFKMEDL